MARVETKYCFTETTLATRWYGGDAFEYEHERQLEKHRKRAGNAPVQRREWIEDDVRWFALVSDA